MLTWVITIAFFFNYMYYISPAPSSASQRSELKVFIWMILEEASQDEQKEQAHLFNRWLLATLKSGKGKYETGWDHLNVQWLCFYAFLDITILAVAVWEKLHWLFKLTVVHEIQWESLVPWKLPKAGIISPGFFPSFLLRLWSCNWYSEHPISILQNVFALHAILAIFRSFF